MQLNNRLALVSGSTAGIVRTIALALAQEGARVFKYRTVDDVCNAVKTFIELYNSKWRVEKNGFRSPDGIRQVP